jgi:hypothetical protein
MVLGTRRLTAKGNDEEEEEEDDEEEAFTLGEKLPIRDLDLYPFLS